MARLRLHLLAFCLLAIVLSPTATWAFEYRVCVRPPDVPRNVGKWAYPPKMNVLFITPDNGEFLIKSRDHVVYVYDPWASPDSVKYFPDKWRSLVCPKPPTPPKPVAPPPPKPADPPPKKEEKPKDAGPPGVKDFVGEKPLTEEEKHFLRKQELREACLRDPNDCDDPSLVGEPLLSREGVLKPERLLPTPEEMRAQSERRCKEPGKDCRGGKTTVQKIVEQVVIGGAIFNLQMGEDLHRPDGKPFGIVGGMNADGPNDPLLQAVAAVVLLTPAQQLGNGFMKKVAEASAKGEKVILTELKELTEEAAEQLMKDHGGEVLTQALAKEGTIGPYKVWKKFTEGLESRWQAHHILEKQMFERFGIKGPDMGPAVILSEAEHKKITDALRTATGKADTLKKLWEGYVKTYAKDHPEWLRAIKSYFPGIE